MDGQSLTLVVDAARTGMRLDKFLAEDLVDVSRTRLQDLIRNGHVYANGQAVYDPNSRVETDGTYVVELPSAVPAEPVAQNIPLTIVFEDEHLIVIDKPAGLVVHPSAGHEDGTLVNALIAHCGESLSGIGGVKRPGIVHRIDKDTSGLLVVAKTDPAHRSLSDQFAAHGRDGRLHRAYRCVAWGLPLRPKGVIDAPLGRSVANRKKVAVSRNEQGRSAVTRYRLERSFKDRHERDIVSQLQLELETGRTHQIRVHMAHLGHPLLGDPVYGVGFRSGESKLSQDARDALTALGRQALHAGELSFEHPLSSQKLSFESALPEDIKRLIAALEVMSKT